MTVMPSKAFNRAASLLVSLSVFSLGALQAGAAGKSPLQPADLQCEYLESPVGISVYQPRLSWILKAADKLGRAEKQSAYQLLVASDRQKLNLDRGNLWDTGKTNSEMSIQIPYRGELLFAHQECFWKVRVWDQDGRASAWSKPAKWSMGLLGRMDFHGKWIGFDPASAPGAEPSALLGAAQWIWFPGGQPQQSAPVGNCYFQHSFDIPALAKVRKAILRFTADNSAELFVNGKKVGTANDFHAATEADVTSLLKSGSNLFAASVNNAGTEPNPAGLIVLLQVELNQGDPLRIVTDSKWFTITNLVAGWQSNELDHAAWKPAQVLGAVGGAPWGQITGPEDRRLEARYLRREFEVEKKVQRATAYVSGLGSSELYLNGQKVGDHVLSPGLTDYTKRIFYVAHDVTSNLRRGRNAAGVILGNGRFYAPRSQVPTATVSYGFPKLFFQMHIEYTDGTTDEVISDSGWNLSTSGPIRANNEYDGEEYDARREMIGWDSPGFDDSKWLPAQMVRPPGGDLVAEMIDPIRVTGVLKPVALTQPEPGTWIFDMGQNMVGWCRLKVSGPAGTQVTLRHSEILKADGTLYLDNIRSAKVTDVYTLKGKGTEVYEPRFTYHGFRYVEVKGYPGKPSLSSLEGRIVNDDLEAAGTFECSNPLLNRIYTNIFWGVRGNYRSFPTDCPQRDERQAWLGDRSAESKGETYLFRTAALYGKWLQDMADAQKESGSVSDVCPAYWPLYSDNVTWPSSSVIIPGTLLEQFGDRAVIARHYPSAQKWVDYMTGFLTNGIISRDSYGDWCVPPEEQSLIHSNDPKRKTDKAILATTYFYYDLNCMSRYAALLDKPRDVRRYEQMAAEIKTAFNRKFYNAERGYYDNGSQTSCVLPLSFGLVPEDQRSRVFGHLVEKITRETDNHIGTGLVGGQWLMRVLTDNGRADLAYTIAAQKTYPSWGYMVEKGATTIWELWNGNTADPAMNSGNHVMLVGDLLIWFYENLAGIKPDPAQPGFKHIIMRPETVGDLRFVRASHRSPYGLIKSEWQKNDRGFRWNITVPPNSTATIHVPAQTAEAVRESGKPAATAPGVKSVRFKEGRVVFEIGSGTYLFECN